MAFLASLFSGVTMRMVMYGAIVAAIAFGLYKFHYQPINLLKKEVITQRSEIQKIKLDLHNCNQLLLKAKADITTEKMNTELCYAEADAYKEVNETIKDTSDEGYITF